MVLHVFVFLLVVCLLLSLARLGRHDWLHLRPSSSRGGAKRSTLHRLLKPRSPDDCRLHSLVWRRASACSCAPLARGEKSAGRTQAGEYRGLRLSQPAMPVLRHHRCSDPHPRRRWQARPGRTDPNLSRPCLPHHLQRATSHALVPFKTPSQQVAVVLAALAEGLDASEARRVFGYRQATITSWLTRAGRHAESLHERCFRDLHLPHLQLDELRTRLRSATQVLWLWLAIDPRTKIVPVFQLGPRTQHMAHALIHSLRESLAAFLSPPFHQ
jgi:hypothetical protein